MELNLETISDIFKTAENDSRHRLLEYEIYEMFKNQKFINQPLSIFIEKDCVRLDDALNSIPGETVVLKVVSSLISHKTEVGGIKIINKSDENIRDTVKGMLADVSGNYASKIEDGTLQREDKYLDLSDEILRRTVYEDIKGVLLAQYILSEFNSFGSELLVGIRSTREFGPIISAGIGGTDTELFAGVFQKGLAFVTASTAMTTGEEFLNIFKQTVIYKKLAGLTRGQNPVSVDEALLICFSYFISLANYFSLCNPEAPYVIQELEINPFVFHEANLVPLDGLCRFSCQRDAESKRPWHKIDNLLHPQSIGIIGVSTTRENFGRIILNNIVAEGFNKQNVRIIRSGMDSFEGVSCVPDLESLDIKIDLLVVAVGSDQVAPIVDLVTDREICEAVMLIPGGMGETGESKKSANLINAKINRGHLREDGGPVFLGANCLGVVSHPGKYDTLFIPEEKLPKQRSTHKRNIAFVSQSGAFMITRISKMPELDPAYMISIGNQNDLTLGDMMLYLKDRNDIDVIAVYAEGFRDLDGLDFLRAMKQAVIRGKDVIVYKAGKTEEGKSATGSHTASIAGDYHVFELCVRQAGGIVAPGFTQFEDLLMIAQRLNKKEIKGNRIAVLSGAGFETVGMADSIDAAGCHVEIASLSESTVKNLNSLLDKKGLVHLTEAKNPMDLNPGADDEAHILGIRYLAEDDNVDAVIAGLDPLSPVTRTLFEPDSRQYDYSNPGSILMELPRLVHEIDKPVIGVVDAGKLFDPMVQELRNRNVIVFRSADRAVKALAVYMDARLYREMKN